MTENVDGPPDALPRSEVAGMGRRQKARPPSRLPSQVDLSCVFRTAHEATMVLHAPMLAGGFQRGVRGGREGGGVVYTGKDYLLVA